MLHIYSVSAQKFTESLFDRKFSVGPGDIHSHIKLSVYFALQKLMIFLVKIFAQKKKRKREKTQELVGKILYSSKK
jgi:hypothetical protein